MESMLVRVEPLTTDHTINEVGELMLKETYERFLCLPVVESGQLVGSISRNILQKIFMSKHGRELLGGKSVVRVMNVSPLVVDVDTPIEEASQYVTQHIRSPITEDFIMTRRGEYCGVGHVVDLLRSMEQRLAKRNQEIAQAYHRLKSSQAQLVQTEKMASLGQMIAGIAHEINTPLGYVKNNVELARDFLGRVRHMVDASADVIARIEHADADPAAIAANLATFHRLREDFEGAYSLDDVDSLFEDTLYGVEQITEIVLNLRNFSRLDKAPTDNVNLNQCLDSALLIARNVLKHRIEVIKYYGDIPAVSCSPSQMNQVFLNLLTNAAQSIQGEGRITIKTYTDEEEVHVVIQDSGKGIAQLDLKRIFDPFFTTKPVGEGTGLGLAIVYQIVKAHRGRIRVGSEIGVGTRFCVSLPRAVTLN